MRIGIIIPEFPSYTETFFLSQINGLCERGHEVFVFCSQQNADPVLEKNYRFKHSQNLTVVNLNARIFSRTGLKNILFHPFVFFRGWNGEYGLRRSVQLQLCKVFMSKFNCDIYHFGYSSTAIRYLPLLNSLPGKVVISCRGTEENIKPLTEPGSIAKLSEVFQAVERIHCVSGHMVSVISQYGAPAEKIFVNRPAIDTNYFKRKVAYAANNAVHILTVGRLVFQKGLMTGILAMRPLFKKYPAIRWVIAGDGPDLEELVFHINLFGLNEHIIITGQKTRIEVFELYQQCDLFFLPSVSEGIANVVLEAMSMELPVVVSKCGGMSEVITHETDGLLTEVYDHVDMTKQLIALITDKELYYRIASNCRNTIIERFSVENQTTCFEVIYSNIAQKELPTGNVNQLQLQQ